MKTGFLLFTFLLFFTVQKSLGQTPNWNWARSASGNATDEGSTVATDASGNIYVSGYYSSDFITIGSVVLQNAGLSFNDIFLAKYDPTGNLIWAQRFGGSSNDRGTSITTDKAGNVYLTGYFYSPEITFGTFTLTNAGNVGDIFVVKFDSLGNIIWAKRDGGVGLEIPYTILVDGNNNIIVSGRFSSNSITFGTTTLLQAGSMDVFLVKYDASGNVLWAKGAGGGSNDEGYSLGTDVSGNIYLSGYFTQPANFGTIKLTSAGQADMFLAKYDPSGNVLWAKRAGGNGDDRGVALKTDASGNSYVTGFYTNDSISFGSVLVPDEAVDNSFVAKYDTDGNVVWAKGLGGDIEAEDLAVFNTNIYICGTFNADTLKYGSSSLICEGSTDLFLLDCDTNGNPKWAIKQTSDGESGENARSVEVDGAGNVIVSGAFRSEPIFFGTSELNSNRGADLFVAKMGSAPTGITESENTREFIIYPNPGNGRYTLQTKFDIKTVEIYTISGSKIYARNLLKKQGPEEIDISSFPSGIYMLSLFDGRRRYTEKLIMRND
jgi:hypothetical protein